MALELWFYIFMLTGLLCAIGVMAFFGSLPKIRRTDVPRCDTCDYDLSATSLGDRCPECGGFARTHAAGDVPATRHQRLANRLCLFTPPIAIAVLYALMKPASTPILAAIAAGLIAAVPISLAVARLIDRAATAELIVLTASATVTSLAFIALFLADLGPPFDKAFAFTCAPMLGIGPSGWGAALGAIMIWIRSEYFARR